MLYNVLHGFHETRPPYEFERERLAQAQKCVRSQNPDILGITEACYGGPNPYNVRLDYATAFGYTHSVFVPWGSHEWGNCLLSRFPFASRTLPLANRTALRAKFKIASKSVTVDLVHLDPRLTPAERTSALTALARTASGPYVMMGDLNCVSPADRVDPSTLARGFESLVGAGAASEAVSGLLDPTPFEAVMRLGLRDACYRLAGTHHTVPTPLGSANRETAVRVDHILVSAGVEVIDAHILDNASAAKASDHYPVIVDLEVD